MSIPVITDHFQVQWAWQGPSGLPEDQFVTTWYFRNDSIVGGPGQDFVTYLTSFWLDVPTGQSFAIFDDMPNTITEAKVKVYDLGFPSPRYPVYEATVSTQAAGSSATPLPREVCIVNSYYSGQGPRRRGRNYLGPFTEAVVEESASGVPRVGTGQQAIITAAAEDLNGRSDVTWVQVSPTDGVANPVLGGWVDNAFDTQRSRGKAPDNRTTWGSPPS